MAKHAVPVLLLGCALSGALPAEEETTPDMAFLEYLGMWDEADEQEWPLLAEDEVVDSEEGSDATPEGEGSVEKDDEN